ncbi:MAG: NIPSNAP family protein, partial [Vicinamibacterales bacterium]
DGKLPLLQARFRDHTIRIFNNHNMKSVGYWVPQDAPAKDNTLVYIISHDSREAAKKSWADFMADPEWKKVSAESQVEGPIVTKVVSVFMDATDYSPIK